jgi:hypothetical protein
MDSTRSPGGQCQVRGGQGETRLGEWMGRWVVCQAGEGQQQHYQPLSALHYLSMHITCM